VGSYRAGVLAGGLAASAFMAAACSGPLAPPAPPSGGRTYVLDYAEFTSAVDPILTRRGCDAGGDCHGGGIRGTLALSPTDAKDPAFDFDQVCLQVNGADPTASPILLQPLALAAGGAPHPYKPFADTADSDYVAILAWIEHGEFR
jgi:hypothetical protein